MSPRTIVDVETVDCTLIEASWDFEVAESDAIEQHWTRRRAANPHLFNGRVLMLDRGSFDTRALDRPSFRGCCFATDFKAFMAWREFGFPPTTARNIFGMTAIETADGAFVLGEMAPHTAPAGWIYFPSGTPDLDDVRHGRVDIEGSAARELAEETGLMPGDVSVLPGVTLVVDPVRVCCMKRVRVEVPAETLVRRIDGWLAGQTRPELARMHVVRSPSDFRAAMPDFIQAYLRHRLAHAGP